MKKYLLVLFLIPLFAYADGLISSMKKSGDKITAVSKGGDSVEVNAIEVVEGEGVCLKYSNGYMDCSYSVAPGSYIANASYSDIGAAGYRNTTWTFPVEFIEKATVVVTHGGTSSYNTFKITYGRTHSTTIYQDQSWWDSSTIPTDALVHFRAFGKWK